MEMKTPEDWIDRLRNKDYQIHDWHRDDIATLIEQLVETRRRRGKLLVDIFNCDEAPELPVVLLERIEAEINPRPNVPQAKAA